MEWGQRTSALDVAEHFADQLNDRVIVLTGPSKDGIGLATALALASQKPRLIVFVGRTMSKMEESRDEVAKGYPNVEIRLVQGDLADNDSVRRAAESINSYHENIDILINNAAVMDTPFELTKDGYELQLASNYLGHWILTESIIEKVLKGKNKRVVVVSSMGHASGPLRWDDPNFTKAGEYSPGKGYGQSKTACNLYAIDLTTRYGARGLTAFSLHPGGIETPLQKHWSYEYKMSMNEKYGKIFDENGKAIMADHLPWKTADHGSSTTLRAALDPSIASESGSYLDDAVIANDKVTPWAKNKGDASRLYEWTQKLLYNNPSS